jgi:parallel beta-helix repeat protein
MLRNNDVSNNTYNYNVVGWLMPDCIQDIDCSNTADGKPVYYWINRRDITVPLDAGYVALINCTRITVQNLTLANNFQGIFLAFTTNSTITNNDLTNNIGGIMLVNASDNTISGNLISNSFCGISLLFTSNNTISENNILNNVYGIQLTYCEGDILYHNSLVNSSFMQVFFDETTISWDNGCEGNFWSDYNGTDSDGNGIGDTPYIIICFDETSQDNYPLMKPRNLLFGDINFDLKIDMRDIGVAAWSLGSYLGHPRWNSYADLNEDGRLDMKDLITIANNFGKTYSRIN